MLKEESKFKTSPDCMDPCFQPELRKEMRKTLVSWLVEVCIYHNLSEETWYISVNIVDRFCMKQVVNMKEYQLLGVAALLIASKYEEIRPPAVNDFVVITECTYSRENILEQESKIIKALEFEFTIPTVYRFIERFSCLIFAEEIDFYLACYFGELSMVKVTMNQWLPSQIASASIYLARRMNKRENTWPKELESCTEYSERKVRLTARDICKCINKANTDKYFEPIYSKYKDEKYLKVSQIPI